MLEYQYGDPKVPRRLRDDSTFFAFGIPHIDDFRSNSPEHSTDAVVFHLYEPPVCGRPPSTRFWPALYFMLLLPPISNVRRQSPPFCAAQQTQDPVLDELVLKSQRAGQTFISRYSEIRRAK